ncbi:MAG TPA: hypothetical protein VGS19_27865 [Streptosporangiaceae bacterium]|nr:hypothetical protein [Streptosporangiaceae bacterium]
MKTSTVLAVAAVTCAAALGSAGGASAATRLAGASHPATVARWQVIKTVHSNDMPAFTAMAVTGMHNAWAFASTSAKTAAWRMEGTAWREVAFPGRSGDQVLAAGASAPDNVWAFASLRQGSGRALHWDGTRWSVVRQFSKTIGNGLVLGPRDVWVFGEPYVPGNGLGTWHYDGKTWTRYKNAGALTAASALSPSSIWAVGDKTAAHWDGSRWSLTSLAKILPPDSLVCHSQVTAVYAASPGDVWAAGMGGCDNLGRAPFVLLHFNGTAWQRVASVSSYGEPYQVVPDGSGGLWIPVITGFPGTFSMLHYSGGHLGQVPLPLPGPTMRMGVAHVSGSTVTFGDGASYQDGVPQAALIFKYSG